MNVGKEETETRLSTTQREILGIARMMRVIVTAPERVLSLLDSREYLSATLSYYRAVRAHTTLDGASQNPVTRCVAARVPLVSRQWAVLATTPSEISERCWAEVSQSQLDSSTPAPRLSLAHCGAALAAVMVLEKVEPDQLVAQYFEHRTEALQTLQQQQEGTLDAVFCGIVDRVVSTLVHADALFCPQDVVVTAGTTTPSSPAQQEALTLRQALLCRVVHRLDRQRCLPPDTEDFVADLARRVSGASFVASEFIRSQCEAWLRNVEICVSATVARSLASVRTLSALRNAAVAVTQRAADPAPAMPGGQSWHVVACALLGRDYDVWKSLFCDAFRDRAAAVVETHSDALSSLARKLVATLSDKEVAVEESNNDDNCREGGSSGVALWNAPRVPDPEKIAPTGLAQTDATVAAFATGIERALSAICDDVEHVVGEVQNTQFCGAFCGIAAVVRAGVERAITDTTQCIAARIRGANTTQGLLLRCAMVAQTLLNATPSLVRAGTLCGFDVRTLPCCAELARIHGEALRKWTLAAIDTPLSVFQNALSAVQWDQHSTALALRATFEPVLQDAGGGGKTGGRDGAVMLPAFLTPCLSTLLWDICASVVRAHGASVPRAAALFLGRVVSDRVLAAYDSVVTSLQTKSVEVDAAVQLWLDVYAVGELFGSRTALVDPRDVPGNAFAEALSGSTATATNSVLNGDDGWPSRVSTMLNAVQALLDPVERGYFRPHMRACVLRCLQRSSLVLTLFNTSTPQTSSPLSPSTTRTTMTATTAATVVPCARVAPRFALLPSTSSVSVAAAALAAPWLSQSSTASLSPSRRGSARTNNNKNNNGGSSSSSPNLSASGRWGVSSLLQSAGLLAGDDDDSDVKEEGGGKKQEGTMLLTMSGVF